MKFKLLFPFVLALLLSSGAQALPLYVGSYSVFSGPGWTTNPAVYSALDAADINFGVAVGGFYSISTLGSDANLIDNMGWYDVIGIGPAKFAEGFSKDTGPQRGITAGAGHRVMTSQHGCKTIAGARVTA